MSTSDQPLNQKFAKLADLLEHHAKHVETPHQPLRKRRILAVAGVNGAGKSAIENLFPAEMIYGMSSGFIPEIIEWWNRLAPQEKALELEKVKPELRPFFKRQLKLDMILPLSSFSAQKIEETYLRKDAFGKVISDYLQRARNPHFGGHAHAVIERAVSSIRTQHAVITGVRSLGDFEYLLTGVGQNVEVGFVYIDAATRMADRVRGETERDLLRIWQDLFAFYEGFAAVIDNNGTQEAFQRNVARETASLQAFVGLTSTV